MEIHFTEEEFEAISLFLIKIGGYLEVGHPMRDDLEKVRKIVKEKQK